MLELSDSAPAVTDSILFLDWHRGIHICTSIWSKACADRKPGQIVRFECFCDDAVACSFEEKFFSCFIDKCEDADEAGALVFFFLHAVQKKFNPLLVRRLRSRAPASRVDSEFLFQCFDDDSGIIGQRGDFGPIEIEMCFLDRIRLECISFFMRCFRDADVGRGEDLYVQTIQCLLDLDDLAFV